MSLQHPTIGFVGLGAMGRSMALNLVRAGYSVVAFDVAPEPVDECVKAGATASASVPELVDRSDVVLTSLPTPEVFVHVAETEMVPNARDGQIFVDLGTVMPSDVRRLAEAFRQRSASLLDAPVSGGVRGAAAGDLRIFVGGRPDAFERVRPVLRVLGDPDFILHCGDAGAGQQVKFVNQMAMGLSAAAHLEALSLGVGAGIDADLLARALGGTDGWRSQLAAIARAIDAGHGNEVGIKAGQFRYFLGEAQDLGLRLPITEALHAFCADGERIVVEANRPSPSFWHELTKGGRD